MKVGRSTGEERVIKEYPHSTRWLEGIRILGTGNLVLTTQRLVFLHAVELTPEQAESLHKLAGAPFESVMKYALKLDGRNFQIPLAAITDARTGVFAWLPFPRFCLRVYYLEGRKQTPRVISFQFTIPILQGIYKTEIAVAWAWARLIRNAARQAEQVGGQSAMMERGSSNS